MRTEGMSMRRCLLDDGSQAHPLQWVGRSRPTHCNGWAWGCPSGADGLAAALAGADADAVLQRQHEDLAVADLAGVAGAGGVHDRLDRRLHERLVDGDLQLDLRQQPDLELAAAVDLGEAALPAAAAD